MTKPSYEERRITKHSGSPQSADSASRRMRSEWRRKIVLLAILAAVLIGNAGIVELDRLYRVSMVEVAAPGAPPAVGVVEIFRECTGAKGDGKTDDSAALQACIDGTSPAPMEFRFPPATYLLKHSIQIRDDRNGISIIGASVQGPEREAAITIFKAAEN